MTEYLNFLATTVRLEIDAGAEAAFTRVRSFFRHLLAATAVSPPAYDVRILPYDPDRDVPPDVWSIEPSVIRRSNARDFNFDAHIVDRGERRQYVNRATFLEAPRDVRTDRLFELRITPGSAIQMIDFLRDLVIRTEEDRGTVVLHASGIRRGDRVVAIAGPKGAGKTTTLLSALRNPNWTYFTGDKLFCQIVGDQVIAHPWRDYPFVGVGSILADDRLTALVREHVDPDVERRPAADKLLIDPDLFESWLGAEFSPAGRPLTGILLPAVRPGQPLRMMSVTDDNARWSHLNTMLERQADTTFFGWHSYLVPDYARFFSSLSTLRRTLAPVPMIRLTGTLDVDPDRVPGLTEGLVP